jgi:hypothetical protein
MLEIYLFKYINIMFLIKIRNKKIYKPFNPQAAMDIVSEYKYAYAKSRDILEGNVQIRDLSSFEVKYNFDLTNAKNSGVYIPQFMAIYQFQKPLIQTADEREMKESIENSFYAHNIILNETCDMLLRFKFGKDDRIDPNLTCIAYDSKIIPDELARMAFNDKVGRVKFTDYKKLPDFNEKNTAEIGMVIDKLSNISNKKSLYSIIEERKFIEKDMASALTKQFRAYGLTRSEHVFLELHSLDEEIRESKVYRPCKHEISSFFEKQERKK